MRPRPCEKACLGSTITGPSYTRRFRFGAAAVSVAPTSADKLQPQMLGDINIGSLVHFMALASRHAKAGAGAMTDRPPEPRTIEQQAQQHAERNRSATQRGLQRARHEKHQETPEPSDKHPKVGSPSGHSKPS